MYIYSYNDWTLEEARNVLQVFGINTHDRTQQDMEAIIDLLIEEGKLELNWTGV